MLLFAHIGWGKPVQVDPRNYNRNITVEKADAIVSFAGPLMNFITAIVFALIYGALLKFSGVGFLATNIGTIISGIIGYIIINNIGLGIFNLIPLPPLDGSKILLPILPRDAKYWFIEHEQIFYFIFIIIWITGIASDIISPLIFNMSNWVMGLAGTIFKI